MRALTHAGILPQTENIQLVGAGGEDIPCHGERFVKYQKGEQCLGVKYKVAEVRIKSLRPGPAH